MADVGCQPGDDQHGDTYFEGMLPNFVQVKHMDIVQSEVTFKQGEEASDVTSFSTRFTPLGDVIPCGDVFLPAPSRIEVNDWQGMEDETNIGQNLLSEVGSICAYDADGKCKAAAGHFQQEDCPRGIVAIGRSDQKHEWQQGLVAESILPKMELDISDNNIPRACERIANWPESTG